MYDVAHVCATMISKIKKICSERKLTYRAVALKANISTSTMYKLMDGAVIPFFDTLLKICNALDVSVAQLLNEDESEKCSDAAASDEEKIVSAYRNMGVKKQEMLRQYIEMLGQYDGTRREIFPANAKENKMKLNEKFALREIAGKTVAIPVGAAGEQIHGMIRLNAVGRLIWEGLAQELSSGEIVEKITDKYDVTEEQAQTDVNAFVEKLKENGILEQASEQNKKCD